MIRRCWTACIGAMLSCALGCAMCANPYDDTYATHGGSRPRADRLHGRVGSIFEPAGEVWEAPYEEIVEAPGEFIDAPGEIIKVPNEIIEVPDEIIE